MKIATIKNNNREEAAVIINDLLVSIDSINKQFQFNWSTNLFDLINNRQLGQIKGWLDSNVKFDNLTPIENINFAPPFRRPGKIWGIGLNYVEHANDLSESVPVFEPASFMKPFTTIIGHNEKIVLPKLSEKVTGEAELGIIIGKECKNVERENWLDVVAGFTCVLDMTAEDILRKNPRYLTLSKSFDTFFSFGPIIYTPDEFDDILNIEVATILNGNFIAKNIIKNMTFKPDYLVSFHSKIMTLLPGDIISTGTPRATKIINGNKIECKISGMYPLKNKV
ncbi:MAG: fumarylacetoacetate hydrolase family protein, partial [Ignavibacteriales bacterium]|nr:fumarylacetoacetate hydrolase family protein [Ignavibacteriales bacterium]